MSETFATIHSSLQNNIHVFISEAAKSAIVEKGRLRSTLFGERFRSYSNDYELVVKIVENDVFQP